MTFTYTASLYQGVPSKVISQTLNQQRGLGLVELMISITLSLVIMAGVINLFVASNQNAVTVQGASRLQENIRYALKRIGDDITQAGNLGCLNYSSGIESTDASLGAFINNQLVGFTAGNASWNDFSGSFISGADNNIDGADGILDGTDTLIVKYLDNNSTVQIEENNDDDGLALSSAVTFTTDDVLFAGDCNRIYVFKLSADVDGNTDIVMSNMPVDHQLKTGRFSSIPYLYTGDSGAYEYFIGSTANGACSDAQKEDCSLFRTFNGGTPQELVLGVHSFNVQYGREESGSLIYTDLPADANARAFDRVRIRIGFNAINPAVADNLQEKTITRVFAIRNQFEQ